MKNIMPLIFMIAFSSQVLAAQPNPAFQYFVNGDTPGNWHWVLSDPSNWWMPLEGNIGTSGSGKLEVSVSPDESFPGAIRLAWNKTGSWAGASIFGQTVDLSPYENKAQMILAIKVEERSSKPVEIKMICGDDCSGKINISDYIKKAKLNEWFALPIALNCFSLQGVDLSKVNRPFEIGSSSKLVLHLAEISILPLRDGEESCAG